MAAKKFLSVFLFVIFGFLFIAGFTIIAIINNAEGRAIENLLNPQTTPDDSGRSPIDISDYIDIPQPVNFILMASDQFKNTDTMILMNFDPRSKSINAMFIPRDILIPQYQNNRINSLYLFYGENRTRSILSELFNINIKYHVIVNYQVVESLVDEFGGLRYTIPIDMHYDDPTQNLHIHFDKGQTLNMNGKQVVEYLRYRIPNNGEYSTGQTGTDLERIARQTNLLKEFFRQKSNFIYVDKLRSVVDILFSNINTNIDIQTTLQFIRFLPEFNLEDITWHVMPGSLNAQSGSSDFVPDYARVRAITSQYFKGTSE